MAPLGGPDPLYGVSDLNACTGLAFRLRQHIGEPRSVVEALRTVAARMKAERPHNAARLTALTDDYERLAVTPSLAAARALDEMAQALRYREQAPEVPA